MLRRAFLAGGASVLAGCSSMQTVAGDAPMQALSAPTERIQLRVRAGDPRGDIILYDMAFEQFSQVMHLVREAPYSGFLDIIFVSEGVNPIDGASSSIGGPGGSGWYIGRAPAIQLAAARQNTAFSSGAFLTWQHSTMSAILRRGDGERAWTANYAYQGALEVSGLYVNTAEEAAGLITRRLRERYEHDMRRRR